MRLVTALSECSRIGGGGHDYGRMRCWDDASSCLAIARIVLSWLSFRCESDDVCVNPEHSVCGRDPISMFIRFV